MTQQSPGTLPSSFLPPEGRYALPCTAKDIHDVIEVAKNSDGRISALTAAESRHVSLTLQTYFNTIYVSLIDHLQCIRAQRVYLWN